MATALNLDPDTLSYLDDLVARGRYPSREEAVREGMRLVQEHDWTDEEVGLDALDPELRALLQARIAEADADPEGGIPAEEVFAEMERLCLHDLELLRNHAQ